MSASSDFEALLLAVSGAGPQPIQEDRREYIPLLTNYMDELSTPDRIVEKLRALRYGTDDEEFGRDPVEFDTIVGTGMSGVLPLIHAANALNVHWVAVRKENERLHSHTKSDFEGRLGRKWLFLDDFVSTGATIKRVMNRIEYAAMSHSFNTEFVGVLEYHSYRQVSFIPPLAIKARMF